MSEFTTKYRTDVVQGKVDTNVAAGGYVSVHQNTVIGIATISDGDRLAHAAKSARMITSESSLQ